jgi:triphosphatase
MAPPDREFELKLGLTGKELERLAANPKLSSKNGCIPKKLRSVYYDTPDHRLYAQGMVLRVRDTGSGFVQTIKLGGYSGDGVSDRVEVEDHLENSQPDLTLIHDAGIRSKVLKAIKDSALGQVFETNITRTTYRLRSRNSVIELALDRGETCAINRRSKICEAELELIRGHPEDLLQLAQALFAGTAVRPSALTKAERGYRLLSKASPRKKARPVYAEPAALSKGQSCGQAFAAIMRQAREQIVLNRTAVLETDDPEAVHQLRVGLTRLRSAHRALEALVDSRQLRLLEADAQAVSRAVGHLRDADVLIAHICIPVAGAGPREEGFDGLLEAVQAHREACQREARVALEGKRWMRLCLSLTLWPAMLERNPALRMPVEDYVDKLLDKRWKKAAKLGRNIESLNGEEQHSMRKSLKKLRYTAEFMAPLYHKNKVGPFIRRLKQLQDIFGYLNDVRMASALPGIAKRHGGGAAPLIAAGAVLSYHETAAAEAWLQAHKAWRRLKASGPFWK